MSQTERIYQIKQLLNTRRSISSAQLQDILEISRATLKRDIEYLRSRLNIPIEWSKEAGGYYIERSSAPDLNELPGLHFSHSEIHALLTMQHLLTNLDPGELLAPHITPLMARLEALLGASSHAADEIRKRVLIAGMGKRALKLTHFERVGTALLQRKRLHIRYAGRGRGETTQREISPQRLVYYRDNWHLEAWCHLRQELRNFSVDAIQSAEILTLPAEEVALSAVHDALGQGYGIFGGTALHWARLRFSPERARWVASEHWHPQQRGSFDAGGCYTLEVPYADDRELIMDILKHGGEVEALAPPGLVQRVKAEVARMAARYA
jgi:predicted DNA-binding transcriptional regulator YafY